MYVNLPSYCFQIQQNSYTIAGNFAQTSGGLLVMGLGQHNSLDHLSISGAATFAGTFQFTAPDGTMFWPGSSYVLISYGAYSGAFDSYALPSTNNPGYPSTWDPRYNDPYAPEEFGLWLI